MIIDLQHYEEKGRPFIVRREADLVSVDVPAMKNHPEQQPTSNNHKRKQANLIINNFPSVKQSEGVANVW